jgi:hypothetical protein
MQTVSIDQLKNTTVFAAALRELDETNQATRQDLVAQLGANSKSLPEETRALCTDEQKLLAEKEAIRQRMVQIDSRLGELRDQIHRIGRRGDSQRRLLRDRLMASADQRIYVFLVWAERAKNLANLASFSPFAAVEGATQSAEVIFKNAIVAARQVSNSVNLCIDRAQQMLLEAQSADEIGLELTSMAAGIYQDYVKVPGVRGFPADYQGPLF